MRFFSLCMTKSGLGCVDIHGAWRWAFLKRPLTKAYSAAPGFPLPREGHLFSLSFQNLGKLQLGCGARLGIWNPEAAAAQPLIILSFFTINTVYDHTLLTEQSTPQSLGSTIQLNSLLSMAQPTAKPRVRFRRNVKLLFHMLNHVL